MASIKRNFAYNSFLTVSNYVINLILFPYCARILGAERFGTTSFVQNVVEYFIFIAMMGITHIGVREIAKQTNKGDLNKCFSSLLILNLAYTFISLLIFIPLIFLIGRFFELKILFFFGAIQILFSTFRIEWLFRGVEDFKYITVRNLLIKVIYVVLVFIFVRTSDDYVLFFILTVAVTIANALYNYLYSRHIVSFTWKGVEPYRYLKSSLSLGVYSILTSMYTTFNVIFLGIAWNDVQVGYYTTAIKLYTVIVGLYSAFTGVMMPRLTSLLGKRDNQSYQMLIEKSISILFSIAIPVVAVLEMLAKEIIVLFAGNEYEMSIPMSRIVVPALFIVGLGQLLSFQILIPRGYDNVTLKASIIGSVTGVCFNIWLTSKYAAMGTCVAVVLTEICVTTYYLIIVYNEKLLRIDFKMLSKHVVVGVPYLLICYFFHSWLDGNVFWVPFFSVLLCVPWFFYSQYYLLHNDVVREVIQDVTKRKSLGK